MANSLNLPQDTSLAAKVLDYHKGKDKQNAELGWLGKIWGVSSSVPNNIAAFAICILLLTGVICTFVIDDFTHIKDLWTLITPVITLAFGYLFGEKTKKLE